MRLIDADALLEELKKTPRYFVAKFDIENAPTAVDMPELKEAYQDGYKDGQNDRPQGEWVKNGAYYDDRAKSMFYKCACSICGITQSFCEDNETGELYSFNFCPNCGTKMGGTT